MYFVHSSSSIRFHPTCCDHDLPCCCPSAVQEVTLGVCVLPKPPQVCFNVSFPSPREKEATAQATRRMLICVEQLSTTQWMQRHTTSHLEKNIRGFFQWGQVCLGERASCYKSFPNWPNNQITDKLLITIL